MSKKVLNVATFGLAGALLKPFGKDKKKPVAPEPGPRVMPLADDEAIRRARTSSLLRQSNRSGRASTILTNPGSTLGG